ncbi:MAG: hypothetical protein WCW93_00255 [Candidatus Paceibacterota bacterium]
MNVNMNIEGINRSKQPTIPPDQMKFILDEVNLQKIKDIRARPFSFLEADVLKKIEANPTITAEEIIASLKEERKRTLERLNPNINLN